MLTKNTGPQRHYDAKKGAGEYMGKRADETAAAGSIGLSHPLVGDDAQVEKTDYLGAVILAPMQGH